MRWVNAKEELTKKAGTYFSLDLKWGHKKVLHYSPCFKSNSLFKRRPWDIVWLDESYKPVSDCKH